VARIVQPNDVHVGRHAGNALDKRSEALFDLRLHRIVPRSWMA
jgi:hypothetical protein